MPSKNLKDVSLKLSISSQDFSVSAFAFIKNENIRIDILRPFAGPISSVYLKGDEAVFQFPSLKKCYKANLANEEFLPWAEHFSVKWVISILKGDIFKDQNCRVQNKTVRCKTKAFTIFLRKKNARKSTVVFKFGDHKKIKIKIQRLTPVSLKKDVFIYSLEGCQLIQKWQELGF